MKYEKNGKNFWNNFFFSTPYPMYFAALNTYMLIIFLMYQEHP